MAKAAKKKSAKAKKASSKPTASAAPPAAQQPIKRIRTAKGRRPYFFDDPNIDKLLAMIMALTGEVSVIRERLDTHERLAEKKLTPTSKNIEAYKPTEAVDQWRVQWRAEYIARILRIVTDELERIKMQESDKDYDKIVEEVSK
jgi:hypothetical protein